VTPFNEMSLAAEQSGPARLPPLSIVLAGDLVLDEPDGTWWLSGLAPCLRAADLAIGHLEVSHTTSLAELVGDVPAPGAPPENLFALADAGFGLVSLAGNHIADCGAQGIADTLAGLAEVGVAATGAGACLAEARRPVIVTRRGWRIALLSYNCVGPEAAWATDTTAGCAWLPIGTADGSPVTPAAVLVDFTELAAQILHDDIAAVRADADIVLVALHKGIVHTPARLAPYERAVAQAAIEAGANAVIGHHAHIVRGIEFHRGKPIFHGLGNGCVVTQALSPGQDHPARAEWAERRKRMFGFEPDPAYTLAPFHPEAINAFLGMLTCHADGTVTAGIVPVHVEPPGRPTLAGAARSREIAAYVEAITIAAGLPEIAIGDDGQVRVMAQ